MDMIEVAADGTVKTPNRPTIPFIEGDGTGRDIWRASVRVFDAAVAKAYKGERKIQWKEVLAGEKAFERTGNWLPDETVEAFKQYRVGIKGPLTTPVGGGIRSLNVALRQLLDLYVCLRPVRYFSGVCAAGRCGARGAWGEAQRAGAKAPGLPGAGVPEGVPEDPLPRHGRRGDQAGVARGHRAAGA